MSEQSDQPPVEPVGDDRDWPRKCEYCGTELESAVVDVVPDSDSEHLQTGSPATVIAEDFCPNPECPATVAGTGDDGPEGSQ